MLTYQEVPKDFRSNMAFRKKWLIPADRDKPLRKMLWESCSQDILFWLNVCCSTFDPRRPEGQRVLPWITYPFQDEAIRQIEAVFGKEDIGIEKSRTMTATWTILAVFLHQWQFRGMSALGVCSLKEGQVDSGGNPGSLFWKLRFILERQPFWMLKKGEDYQDQKLLLKNHKTGSTITGDSTTGDMWRGERLLALMIDEFAAFEPGAKGFEADAATYAVTNCRIFNSTYKGAAGCFYEKMRDPEKQVKNKISLPWYLHPEYREGLYYDSAGKPRSPWYDGEVRRLVVPAHIKSELDMDPLGAASQYFPSELLERILASDVRKPYQRCRLEGKTFIEDRDGPLSLWMPSIQPNYSSRYVVGCDIAQGAGASNSVASAVDQLTGEKVCELTTSRMNPDEFAEAVYDLCRWLNEAYLIWESNGPGGRFGQVIIGKGYRNVYYRQNEESLSRKPTDTPGWTATDANKRRLLGGYVSALQEGRFVNRSEEAIKECRLIILSVTGKIVNSRAMTSIDPSGAGENHADRPTADALACKGLEELGPRPEPEEKPQEPDFRSLEGRREMRRRELAKQSEW